ncbi:glutamate--tRNA ligase family protein [Bifidobacterium sp. UTBIF-78]|uniref:glutamate--tRNA ligase family protein n=1 Tax=Bifidobacterium sp. UTBIF-78 TaxID=1465263 RepID=UPI002158EFF4|nr:glutamate--tRNA ligase family protein [Bifidobacterium sp. UTBIF-78]
MVSQLLPDGVCAEGPQVSDVLYPCFCSRADIRAASAPNEGDGFMVYPGTCRRLLREHPDEVRERLARGDRHSLRIAMPEKKLAPMMHDIMLSAPAASAAAMPVMPITAGDVPATGIAAATADGPVDREADCGGFSGGRHDEGQPLGGDGIRGVTAMFDDAVYGPQTYDLPHDIGDSVIRRADGLFGYQLVVVVDDLDMGVDDIVRGRDLLRSTALQMWIRHCLLAGGFKPECGFLANPAYEHLPLIDNAAGRRLAKRERSLDMGALRARVDPEQIIGYCAWLLRVRPTPEPCTAAELVPDFSWAPLRAAHPDRALNPTDSNTPAWLAEALSV